MAKQSVGMRSQAIAIEMISKMSPNASSEGAPAAHELRRGTRQPTRSQKECQTHQRYHSHPAQPMQ